MTNREKADLQPSLVTLFAEMQALMGLMPTSHPTKHTEQQDTKAAQEQRVVLDEIIEAGFDNMPV